MDNEQQQEETQEPVPTPVHEPAPTTILKPPTQYPPTKPGKPAPIAPIALSPDQRLTNLENKVASLEARLKKKIANL